MSASIDNSEPTRISDVDSAAAQSTAAELRAAVANRLRRVLAMLAAWDSKGAEVELAAALLTLQPHDEPQEARLHRSAS
jgi:hypothetical protein